MLRRLPRLHSGRQVIRALLDDASAPAALLGRDGRVLQAGGAFLAVAGSEPAFGDRVAAALAEALAQGEAALLTGEVAAADGARPVALSLTPTGLEEPAGVLRLIDLRRQRALEAELAQAQRLQSVGQLAAGVAHDFNNLLTAILGAVEALEPHVPAAGREDLVHIRDGAERGAALVRQLLAFGRQQTLQPRVLRLTDAVREAVALIRCMLSSTIALRLELEEPGRQVRIDPTQLDQVLLNLAANARDAMPDGGTITIATGRRLLLSAEIEGAETLPPGRYVTIEVRDTGRGIPPDVLPHIFEPFFTTRRGAGGTGLGLSTVQGIVRQSGGFLAVSSVPGQGTVFRITLPRHDAPVALPVRTPAAAPSAGDRLLLVDDEAPVRRLAARALRGAGWDVVEAGSADDALAGDCSQIAYLVSDVIMPGMDGPALVRELRRAIPGLPALLVSGYADAGQRKALQSEDIEFLAKPFSMARLVELVGTPRERESLTSL